MGTSGRSREIRIELILNLQNNLVERETRERLEERDQAIYEDMASLDHRLDRHRRLINHQATLGARAPMISGHMLNTLRIQSISDHNVSSGQKSDTFKMYPVM